MVESSLSRAGGRGMIGERDQGYDFQRGRRVAGRSVGVPGCSEMSTWPYFYGLQPRWIGPDRLFKLFVLGDSICAGRVAGPFWDERYAELMLMPAGVLGNMALPWVVRHLVRRREEREARYDSLVPGSMEFLDADRTNFVIHRAEVLSIAVRSKRSLWTGDVPNAGRVDIALIDGSRTRLILLDEIERAAIVEQLAGSLGVEPTVR